MAANIASVLYGRCICEADAPLPLLPNGKRNTACRTRPWRLRDSPCGGDTALPPHRRWVDDRSGRGVAAGRVRPVATAPLNDDEPRQGRC
jgi:hypothetical protein